MGRVPSEWNWIDLKRPNEENTIADDGEALSVKHFQLTSHNNAENFVEELDC